MHAPGEKAKEWHAADAFLELGEGFGYRTGFRPAIRGQIEFRLKKSLPYPAFFLHLPHFSL